MSNEKKKKILIIEDDQVISTMYKIKFTADGYDVIYADTGVKGLESAKKNKPDIILLDIILPELDGFAILQEIKKDSKIKKIPVIMLTNLGTEEDKKKGEKFGAADYIVKASLTPSEVS
ncbi:MAG: response regulator, partial [Patescibacteria group bacterium]